MEVCRDLSVRRSVKVPPQHFKQALAIRQIASPLTLQYVSYTEGIDELKVSRYIQVLIKSMYQTFSIKQSLQFSVPEFLQLIEAMHCFLYSDKASFTAGQLAEKRLLTFSLALRLINSAIFTYFR
ncbi:hypothetical protein ILYODFUR_032811 [Ilyodon furcidens]|uniref:Uncharacterized protein n=1 Tax=Ilyodon furcidens TaxID=33524 RepID=A0ABV0TGV4_9TELE